MTAVLPLQAAPDTVDAAFAMTAGQYYDSNAFGGAASFFIQPDGKILMGSNDMPALDGAITVPLVRFNQNGTIDNTFRADANDTGAGSGIYYDSQGFPEVHGLAMQSDNKIIAVGCMQGMRDGATTLTSTNSLVSDGIVRILPDGTPDTSFQCRGIDTEFIDEVITTADDKILIGGGFNSVRNQGGVFVSRYGIARLNPDGSLDTTFEVTPSELGNIVPDSLFIRQIAPIPGGKYYIAGSARPVGGAFSDLIPILARLHPDGRLDPSFSPAYPAAVTNFSGVVLEGDGNLVVLGSQGTSSSATTYMGRLNSAGAVVPSFTLDGSLTAAAARPLRADPLGRFLLSKRDPVLGNTQLVRINSNGSLDPTFNASGSWDDAPFDATTGFFNQSITSPSGKIYAGGAFDVVNGEPTVKIAAFEGEVIPATIRLASTSFETAESALKLRFFVERVGDASAGASVSISTTPGTATAADFTALSTTLTWAAGDSSRRLIEIDLNDDSLVESDETFTVNLSAVSGAALANSTATITLLDDEAAPVIFEHPVSVTVKEGEIATFSVTVSSVLPVTYQWQKGGVNLPGETARTLSIVTTSSDIEDYQVVVTSVNGSITSNVASLDVIPPSVLVDSAFSFSGVAKPATLSKLADGSVLILDGDGFSGYTLRKFDSNFDIDPAFNVTVTPQSGFSVASAYPREILPLANGQWLATGFFETVNGVTRPEIVRMNADGSVDESFNVDLSGGLSLRGVSVTEDGDIFAMVRTQSQGVRLQRILEDGSFDADYDISLNYSNNGRLGRAVKLSDGSLLISYTAGGGGTFSQGIRKLNPNGTLADDFAHSSDLSGGVTDFFLLPDGRIAVLNADKIRIYDLSGVLEDTFTFTGNPTSLQFDRGHFIVTGATAYGSELLQGGLARLTLTGEFVDNFPGGAGPDDIVTQFLPDASGGYLAVGDFDTWNGVSAPKFTRVFLTTPEAGFESYSLSADEGEALTARIVRTGDTTTAASVRIRSVAGTASSPADYLEIDQVVSWAAGESDVKVVVISLVDDELIEGDLDFSLTLSEAVNLTVVPLELKVQVGDPDSLPQLTTQPVSQEVLDEGALMLSVAATSPTALSYQWLFEGEALDGETAATLSIPSMTEAQAGIYSVEVTNDYGRVLSAEATVVIVDSPAKLADGFASVHTLLGSGAASEVVALADGSAIVGGAFNFISNSVTYSRLVRILPDGSIDPNFTPVVNGGVTDIHLNADESFLITGSFTTVDGNPSAKVARFNADLSLDVAFGAQLGSGPGSGTMEAVTVRQDGKIAVGGEFTIWNGVSLSPARDLISLNANGSFDGAYAKTLTSSRIYDLVVLPASGDLVSTQRVITSGRPPIHRWASDLSSVRQYYPTGLFRPNFNTVNVALDGTLLLAGDDTIRYDLETETIVTNYNRQVTRAIVEQIDDRVIAGGLSSAPRIDRFLSDGSVDPLFAPGTGFANAVNEMSMNADGSIWVVGNFNAYNGTTVNQVARLAGNPVAPFLVSEPMSVIVDPGEDVTFSAEARSTEVISYQWFKDGSPILNATSATLVLSAVDESTEGDYTVTVSNLLGDQTSSPAHLNVRGAPEIVTLSEDLGLIEGGSFTLDVSIIGANPLSYQWQKDGVDLVDDASVTGSTTASLTISGAGLERAGSYRVFVSNALGDITSDPVVVSITLNPAAPAPDFVPLTIIGNVKQILPLPDGRALIGGDFSSISDGTNTSGARLALVGQTGAVIPIPGLSADKTIDALRLQADGKILIAGNFNTIGTTARYKVARLNADLSLDTNFAPLGFQGEFGGALDIAQEASGTIMVVGVFGVYDGQPGTAYAVRLGADGSYDNSFTSGAGGGVYRVFPQSDGDLIFTGAFFSWAPTTEQFVIRTDSSGVFDSSADYNTGFFYVYEALELANGELFSANGFQATVKRFSPTGVEISPSVVGNFNGVVDAMAEDADENLYLGGRFSFVGGTARSRIARFTSDGNLDVNFVPGSGFNADVKDIKVAHNGAIWVGGNFTSYNGQAMSHLALLRGSSGEDPVDPFEEFVASLPVDQQGLHDDPDGDDLSNLLEFAYGSDPSVWNRSHSEPRAQRTTGDDIVQVDPGAAVDPNSQYIVFSYLFPKDAQGVTLTLEATLNLGDFNDGSATLTPFGPPVDVGDLVRQSYYFSPSAEVAGVGFVRMRATR